MTEQDGDHGTYARERARCPTRLLLRAAGSITRYPESPRVPMAFVEPIDDPRVTHLITGGVQVLAAPGAA